MARKTTPPIALGRYLCFYLRATPEEQRLERRATYVSLRLKTLLLGHHRVHLKHPRVFLDHHRVRLDHPRCFAGLRGAKGLLASVPTRLPNHLLTPATTTRCQFPNYNAVFNTRSYKSKSTRIPAWQKPRVNRRHKNIKGRRRVERRPRVNPLVPGQASQQDERTPSTEGRG